MLFETIKSEGLAHLSYLIGDEEAGACAVIDPRRDIDVYLDLARQRRVRIVHILETHVHADFVSGSRELSARTDAPIYAGASGNYGFEHRALYDGDVVEIGSLTMRVFHTPGHAPEHLSFVVSGGGKGAEHEWAVFTGDILFAGEVGRPDLTGDDAEEQARQLFHSLHGRLLTLDDGVEVYPAHGAGSPCGGSIGVRDRTTIGYERRHNEKLQIESEDLFVRQVLGELSQEPRYYKRLKQVNARGPRVLGALPYLQPFSPEQFQQEMQQSDILVVDTREIEAFGGAHIRGALSIALRSSFPIWAGWMLGPEERILLVLEDEADAGVVQRHLFRTGYENIAGYLQNGMRGWIEAGLPFEQMGEMSVHELKNRLEQSRDGLQLLDVRSDTEWEQGAIPTARHTYAPFVGENLDILDRETPVAVYCGTGYRSGIAASVLQQKGFEVYNVLGSMKAWKAAGYRLDRPIGGGNEPS